MPKTELEVLQAQVEELQAIRNVVVHLAERVSLLEAARYNQDDLDHKAVLTKLASLVPLTPATEPEPVEDLGG